MGYVQRSDYVEAIGTSQQPNDSIRKSDSGTTETASQTLLRSKREAEESRASPSPRRKLWRTERVRVQEQADQRKLEESGDVDVHSVSSTQASHHAK